MSNDKNDFFLHSNVVNHISKEDYGKIELLVNAAKAFARSTYQCVYIIDYFYQDFIYASDNLAYLCGLQPEQLMEAGYQIYIDYVPENDLQMLLEVNKKGDAGPTTKEVFKYLKGKAFGSGKTKRILNKEFDIGKSIVIQGVSLKAKVAEHTIDTAIDKSDNKKM